MKNFLRPLYNKTCLFSSYLWGLVCLALRVYFLQGDEMQSGELDVTGKDKVEINLGARSPCRVIVKFKGGHHHVPCNPKHRDELKWEVKNKHYHHPHDFRHDHCHHEDKYMLMISWDVTNVRTIEWVVYY